MASITTRSLRQTVKPTIGLLLLVFFCVFSLMFMFEKFGDTQALLLPREDPPPFIGSMYMSVEVEGTGVSPQQLKSNPQLCDKPYSSSDPMVQPRTLKQWQTLMKSPALVLKPVSETGVAPFPWEKDYLKFPPLKDSRTLPDLSFSKINIVGANGSKVKCRTGQRLSGRVDLRDRTGSNRRAGLDEVRAWLVDTQQKSRRAVGEVTDLRNGSYSVEVTCLWPGSSATLYVAVSYPREFLRVYVQQHNAGAARYTAGEFKSKLGVKEITLCHPMPNVPGRTCLCNFTTFNSGEYYCGRPYDSRLTCSDLVATYTLPDPQPYHVTKAEFNLIKAVPGSVRSKTLTSKILIETSSERKLPQLPPCHGRSSLITWDMTSRPQGFWDVKKQWTSLVCSRPPLTTQRAVSCLKNSHVYITGDSNMRLLFGQLTKLVQSGVFNPKAWPRPVLMVNKTHNITVHLRAHDYPLFLGTKWTALLRSHGVEEQIDAIPSRGRQIVLFHYYLHLTPFHLSVAQSRMEAAARAIKRLLTRNPDARVAFRGPHVASLHMQYNHCIGGDALGKRYMEIITKAFSGLRDQVVFLDGWEMTTALENREFHPSILVPREMIRTFLAFLCP